MLLGPSWVADAIGGCGARGLLVVEGFRVPSFRNCGAEAP